MDANALGVEAPGLSLPAQDQSPLLPALAPNPLSSPSIDAPLPTGVSSLLPSPAPTEVPPEQAKKMVLDKIASGEAKNYTTIYGGDQFSNFADHPRQRRVIAEGPYKGQSSDAAGRYQMLSSTWDPIAKSLGLKDFSPASQDAGAWELAQSTYKDQTKGRDLLSDAQRGQVDYSKLAGQWSSLRGESSDDWKSSALRAGLTKEQIGQLSPLEVEQFKQFHNSIRGSGSGENSSSKENSQKKSGQNGAGGAGPDTQGLLKLALIQAAFPKYKFTPVDYDPHAVQQSMRVGEAP